MMKTFATCALLLSAIAAPANSVGVMERQDSSLEVDLGYAVYQGYYNATSALNTWKGIRYAAPPVGSLRWKAPQAPSTNKTVTPATSYGPICPQAYPSVPNAPFIPGDEDCLFLNVYAPPVSGTEKLPVLVWIHGGGYGLGDGQQNMNTLINANGNRFIGVAIQYRLGAFGFLSSSEVKSNGVVNAGFLDMEFALKWVQDAISLFGGDKTKVTISGESAGGGAVMLLGIARDANLGTTLFDSGIAASPYLPAQYEYNATKPTNLYYELASSVGCSSSGAVLDCLRKADSNTLQVANNNISTSQTYGTWAYLPVTDYTFITSLPSIALAAKKVNGKNILVGNNANEGALFVPANITTLNNIKDWLKLNFPTFSDADIQQTLDAYPSSDAPANSNAPKFATNGYGTPTAVNVSQVATGQQQRADDIYAEATFVCPSYWLNTAYTKGSTYHYQYSVPFASHQDDVTAYFGPSAPNQSPPFSLAFRKIWGNFITSSNPSVPTGNDTAIKQFPQWVGGTGAQMLNLNETGGVPYQTVTSFGVPVTQYMEPGLANNFTVANAYDWEGGRGKRCDFWKSMATKIPI